jgi:hypothetical protein
MMPRLRLRYCPRTKAPPGSSELLKIPSATYQLRPGGCSGMVVWKFKLALAWGAVEWEESITSAPREPKSAKVISRGLPIQINSVITSMQLISTT